MRHNKNQHRRTHNSRHKCTENKRNRGKTQKNKPSKISSNRRSRQLTIRSNTHPLKTRLRKTIIRPTIKPGRTRPQRMGTTKPTERRRNHKPSTMKR